MSTDVFADDLLQLLAQRMGLLSTKEEAPAERLLEELSLKGVAEYIQSKCLPSHGTVFELKLHCGSVSRQKCYCDDRSWYFNR